jgi:cyclase
LVKTVRFAEQKYVGDPVNAVRIFNEKEVDELTVLDIDATTLGREPDYRLIENVAAESRMPLCYGGGIKTVDQARRIIGLGVEKVAISSAAVENPSLVAAIAEQLGAQSVVVVIDVKRGRGNRYEVVTHNGRVTSSRTLEEFILEVQRLDAGEIVVNSIDYDGSMKGYDLDAARAARRVATVPLTVLGGAGKLSDLRNLISEFGVVGAAAGSLFVFKGIYKAVLINYPSHEEREQLIQAMRGAPV